ncbi:cell wall-active antibiotics response protein LiaF [Streptococcus ferus]|uniref:cell wall-active antibiotics response protein LiaF n=1 Tax=Streptococcus ferus TaxID=1345 RepID=UPI0035A040F7
MRKFQLFLVVETILVALAFMTILASDISSFVLILVITLLALRYYSLGSKNNFLLTTSLLLLFLIFMLNPYMIAAVLVGILYVMINHFAQVKKKNRYALISFQENDMDVNLKPQPWIGNNDYLTRDSYAFDDINLIRLSGGDTIDLSKVIIRGHDNLIIIRKVYGPTKILVPIDVAVKLDVSSIYGSVRFLDSPEYDLRNEAIKYIQDDSESAMKSVKIVVNIIAGSVEVKSI